MKQVFFAAASLAAISMAAPAFARSPDTIPADSSGTSTAATPAPHPHHAHPAHKSMSGGTSSDHYSGVDTAGVHENVKAPYGGHNQTQADKKEVPVTNDLNQKELQGNGLPTSR